MFDFPFHSTGTTSQREAPLGFIGSGKAEACRDHTPSLQRTTSAGINRWLRSAGAQRSPCSLSGSNGRTRKREVPQNSQVPPASRCSPMVLKIRSLQPPLQIPWYNIISAPLFRASECLNRFGLSINFFRLCNISFVFFPPLHWLFGAGEKIPQVLFRDCLWCLRVYECLLEVEVLSRRREEISTSGRKHQCCLISIELFWDLEIKRFVWWLLDVWSDCWKMVWICVKTREEDRESTIRHS